jgi:hypothetical protein
MDGARDSSHAPCGLARAGSLAHLNHFRPRRQPKHSSYIVGEVGEVDFNFRPRHTDRADDKPRRILPSSEGMDSTPARTLWRWPLPQHPLLAGPSDYQPNAL